MGCTKFGVISAAAGYPKLESLKHELHINKPLPTGYGFVETFRILETNKEFKELPAGGSYMAALYIVKI